MSLEIEIRQLTLENSNDYSELTRMDDGRLCYCSFWHQKFSSVAEYDKVKAENPERLKNCVMEKVRGNFHVGVIAYVENKPCAWISVGPLIDFYWTWKRVAQLGESAKDIAGITCFTLGKEYRGKNMQSQVLQALTKYGKKKSWTTIEGYPYTNEAIAKHGPALAWPGLVIGYERAGFTKVGQHWLTSPEAERLIYRMEIN